MFTGEAPISTIVPISPKKLTDKTLGDIEPPLVINKEDLNTLWSRLKWLYLPEIILHLCNFLKYAELYDMHALYLLYWQLLTYHLVHFQNLSLFLTIYKCHLIFFHQAILKKLKIEFNNAKIKKKFGNFKLPCFSRAELKELYILHFLQTNWVTVTWRILGILPFLAFPF